MTNHHPKAWAWRYTDGSLDGCPLQETRQDVQEIIDDAPSERGRPVRVRVVPEADYRRLVKAAKGPRQ